MIPPITPREGLEEFIRADGEPEPVCANCDCYAPKDGNPGKCVNTQSLWFNFSPQPLDGCSKFFPDHGRWPEADHG